MQLIESLPILIRLAQPQDRQAIIQLETLAIKNLCQGRYNAAQINSLINNIAHLRFNDEIIFVAEQEHSIIGFASLLTHRKILRTLYVRPDLKPQNIANQLLEAVEQEAIKQKIDVLKVTSSLTEKTFYQNQGYQEIAFSAIAKMDILVPCIIMQKRFSFSLEFEGIFDIIYKTILATIPNTLLLLSLL